MPHLDTSSPVSLPVNEDIQVVTLEECIPKLIDAVADVSLTRSGSVLGKRSFAATKWAFDPKASPFKPTRGPGFYPVQPAQISDAPVVLKPRPLSPEVPDTVSEQWYNTHLRG